MVTGAEAETAFSRQEIEICLNEIRPLYFKVHNREHISSAHTYIPSPVDPSCGPLPVTGVYQAEIEA